MLTATLENIFRKLIVNVIANNSTALLQELIIDLDTANNEISIKMHFLSMKNKDYE